jgi:hypothetical protein
VADGWKVVWTRGRGCAQLADILSARPPRHVKADLRTACIAARADLLVASALTSFDLVPTVVPDGVDFDRADRVVAAVAGGPHTSLAARVAQRIASVLDVPGTVVSVSQNDEGDREAGEMLERIGVDAPLLERRLLRARSARAVVGELSDDALLVIGAPGGSWLQRQFFGPGKRLISAAPDGIVVVRDAPTRCYQRIDTDPTALGPALRVGDALQVVEHDATPVLDVGRLIGIVRRDTMLGAAPDEKVGVLVEDPVFVYLDDPLDDVEELTEFLDGSPVPVIDREGRLVGTIDS